MTTLRQDIEDELEDINEETWFTDQAETVLISDMKKRGYCPNCVGSGRVDDGAECSYCEGSGSFDTWAQARGLEADSVLAGLMD